MKFLSRQYVLPVVAIVFLFSSFFPSNVKAQSQVEALKTITLNNVSVQQFDEGYIKGITAPQELSVDQKDEILKLLNFTDEDIIDIPDSLKNQLLKEGGVKVNVSLENMKRIYTDLNGNDHLVTEENLEQITNLREADLKQLGYDNNISTLDMGSVKDGKFSGGALVTYLGKTPNASEFVYNYKTVFKWSSRPVIYSVDSIGTAWQSHTTRVDHKGVYKYESNNVIWDEGFKSTDVSSVYGTKGEIDIVYQNGGPHYGYLENEVRIPIRHKGETGTFASGYGHTLNPLDSVSITIKAVGISFSGFGDKWSWDSTFTIGNQ